MDQVCPYLSIQTSPGGESSTRGELGVTGGERYSIALKMSFSGGGGPRLPDPEDDMDQVCLYLSNQTPCGGGSSITEELGMVGG
jgi:hypothetical protein